MRRAANIYTISPETGFLPRLVQALLTNELDLDTDYAAEPLALADLTIYVPTQRAARALRGCFAASLGKKATLLPRILPLGGLGSDEEPLLDAGFSETASIAPLERRLILTQMIHGWGLQMKRALLAIREDGHREEFAPPETFRAVSYVADAFALSAELAGLIDECLIEGVEFSAFERLGDGNYDDYWRITLEFLKIAFEQWPNHLSESGLVDGLDQRRRLISRQAARIAQGQMPGPVIAAGSTGTNEATAQLLKAIARADKGAVILPGLDLDLDAASFDLIDQQGLATHPQAVMARLLNRLEIPRVQVQALAKSSGRARFLSEALRPAPTTELWHHAEQDSSKHLPSFDFLSVIDAENEREEALAIALHIRDVLRAPEVSVALVTPERTLAERVSAELGRWDIVPEDSAGRSLSRTALGALALHLLQAAQHLDAAHILTLISHADFQLGHSAEQVRQLAQMLEAGVLRQLDLSLYDRLVEAIDAAALAAKEPHAPDFLKTMAAESWAELRQFGADLGALLAPLQEMNFASARQWAARHGAALASVTALDGRDGAAVKAMLDELAGSAQAEITCSRAEYQQLIAEMLAERSVRHYRPGHPRLAILGLLEARLLQADVTILGGLDEKVWPPQAQGDALLNRTMRAGLGLSSPERRLGQTAHDFVMAFGQGKVVVSRAKKRGGEPTVASRFLQRIDALAGEAMLPCRARGLQILDMARRLDAGQTPPILRPLPRPALGLRPTALSVTAVEKLRRDPYSIYAERILKLPVLGPLQPDFTARDFGNNLHAIFDAFVKRSPNAALPPQPEQLLRQLAAAEFGTLWEAQDFQTFGRPKVEAMLDAFLAWERPRRPQLADIHSEISGEYAFALADGSLFKLRAKADRADYFKDGRLQLIDFKTGALPSPGQVIAGFAPQLTLEAQLVQFNAFKLPKAAQIDAVYVKFGKDDKPERPAQGTKKDVPALMDLAQQHFDDLNGLLSQLRNENTPYVPRPFPQNVKQALDYDHLSRFKEWSSLGEDGDEE